MTRAKETMLAPHIAATPNQDMEDGRAVGVSRTPTFFVNGKPLTDFGPQQLYELVRTELAAAR
jgi:protein-disulfide isomerase